MRRFLLCLILFFLIPCIVSASNPTDYFRSKASGDWNNVNTWESSSDNTNWFNADLTPDFNAATISIRSGHIVTITTPQDVDQVAIQSGGVLDFTLGTLTVENGSGDDIDIQNGGVFVLSLTATPPIFASSSTCNVATGGILRVSAGGLTPAGAGVNASNFVYNHQSVLEYTLSAAFSTDNVTYFPNVNASTIPIFRTTTGVGTVGANTNTTFNGIFEANGAVTFINSGIKTFRNGIRGTGDITGTFSGKFVINGTTAELGGNGFLIVPNTGGLEIGSPTTVSMISDKTITGNVSLLPTNSLIMLGQYNLTVTGTVSITNPDKTSFIKTNGTGLFKLTGVGPGGKLFTVGNSTINPLYIIDPPPSTADYAVRVTEPVDASIFDVNQAVNRNWYMTCSVVSPNATIGFGYTLATDCNAGYNNGGPVEVGVRVGGVWNILQSGITPQPFPLVFGTFYVLPNPINIFNGTSTEFPFAIANNGAILPLDYFITARAQKLNNNGIISWKVFNTDNIANFELQRSVNNAGFQTIARINPVNNQLDYSYTDASLEIGTQLYRIKVNRLNGEEKYSNTVALINGTMGLLITSMVPNPVRDQTVITLSAAKQTVANFELYDITGKKVKNWSTPIINGNNTISMDMSNMPAGVYHILANTEDARAVYRFVKQ